MDRLFLFKRVLKRNGSHLLPRNLFFDSVLHNAAPQRAGLKETLMNLTAPCRAPVPTSDLCACRKLLNVKIIDDEEYEKNKTFTIVLEEPILLEVGQRHGELGTGLGGGGGAPVKLLFSSIIE